MAASNHSGQAVDRIVTVKISSNMPHCTVAMESVAVPTCDPGSLLATVLESMKQRGLHMDPPIANVHAQLQQVFGQR